MWLTPEPFWREEIRDLAELLSPYRNHPAGASPTCSAWLFITTQTSASKDQAAQDTRLPYLCPHLLPACPLPTIPSCCPAQLGREGTPRMEVLMLMGYPSPAGLHKIQVAAASSKFSGDLLHHTKFPDNSPKKGFLPFAEQY